ncbi:uncharacterized protein ACR2FA_006144 isoform 2-T2 [Aphomia sociella]
MDNQAKKLHYCTHEGCKAVFNRPYRLVQHLLVHNNIRIYVCEEGNCSKSYTSRSHLDRHINSVHKNPEKDMLYRCERCSKDFVSLYEKKKHSRHHKTYDCSECHTVFDTWSKYQKHKKTDHANQEYICDDCGRCFKQRGHLVRHVKVHMKTVSEAKRFLCPYENCLRWYTRNSNLKQHILSKHLKFTHNCHICPARLSTKAKLDYHLSLHNRPPTIRQPKTKATGRKERKDKGIPKGSTAMKLAGMPQRAEDDEDSNASTLVEVCVDVECVYG